MMTMISKYNNVIKQSFPIISQVQFNRLQLNQINNKSIPKLQRIHWNSLVVRTQTLTTDSNNTNVHTSHHQQQQQQQQQYKPRMNKGLESIKEQGKDILDATLSDIISKTKRRLLIEDEDTGPTIYQLKESMKVKRLMEDAIETYTTTNSSLFCIMNDPISIIDVEITEDLRQARVFWSLPYSIMVLDDSVVNRDTREKIVVKMQSILDERGGVLQGMVHTKMRNYFRAPKIRFVPAEGEMLRKSLQEFDFF